MQIQTCPTYEYDENLPNRQMMMMSSFASTSPPTPVYIQHPISKLDTLAGIAIKYGVEVADIRKVNGLVTDMQMFALKTLHIPLNGKHPQPSSTGDEHKHCYSCRQDDTENSPADNTSYELFESFQPLRRKSSEHKLSSVRRSLPGHYGAKPKMKKCASEIFSMVEYEKRSLKYSENGSFYKNSPMSGKTLGHHRNALSLATDSHERSDIMAGVAHRKSNLDKRNATLIRRNHKSEVNLQRIPELLLKQDSSSNGGFSTRSANGLAQRQKSSSRLSLSSYSKQVV
ncbi:uncharacterized protein LOC124837710 [Vigna umbellata]|uniref:uncharacterized protein LOC124837710 n=1 Tax=Vigna umbellata TaxID=87088 RepID=UPI001F5EF95F|nr:uncharacterized protein LOC124837710 [Vigna umbellata]